MINIKNFEIIDNGSKMNIHVETVLNFNITDILIWNKDTYNNYDEAISLNFLLENVNNIENIIVSADVLGLSSFEDMWFVEVFTDYVSDDECEANCETALGITYDLTQYYNCILQYILQSNLTSDCTDCPSSKNKDILANLILLLRSLEYLITACLYEEASETFNKLKKICNLIDCKNCKDSSSFINECKTCKNFKQL